MKVGARDGDRFAGKPPAGIVAVLVYGPDRGLVRERAERLARTVVGDLADPFRVGELQAAALAGDPAALADEARAISLVGGRRLVRVRAAGEEVAPACRNLLADPAGDSLVIVEAGELGKSSVLRKLFESHARAAALACYLDDGATLDAVIRDALAAHSLTAAPGARAYLAQHLGGDRGLTRAEIDKLALYVGEGGKVSEDDARACVGDSAEITLDHLADAVAAGDAAGCHRALERAAHEGTTPVSVLRALERHFQRLQQAKAMVAAGARPAEAVKALKPPVFFKRERAVAGQVARWPADALAGALDVLLQAEIDCKTTGLPDRAVCGQAALRLTVAAQRQAGRG